MQARREGARLGRRKGIEEMLERPWEIVPKLLPSIIDQIFPH